MRIVSLRSFWLPVMLMTLIAAFFGAVLSHRGRDWDRLLAERAGLQAQLGDLEEQNARLRAQREQLLSSPEAIERVAREDYGFASPGEKIQALSVRPSARPVQGPPPARGRFPVLLWDRVSVTLPLSVFVVSAFVFALVNLLSGKDAGEAEGTE